MFLNFAVSSIETSSGFSNPLSLVLSLIIEFDLGLDDACLFLLRVSSAEGGKEWFFWMEHDEGVPDSRSFESAVGGQVKCKICLFL